MTQGVGVLCAQDVWGLLPADGSSISTARLAARAAGLTGEVVTKRKMWQLLRRMELAGTVRGSRRPTATNHEAIWCRGRVAVKWARPPGYRVAIAIASCPLVPVEA